MSQSIQIIDVTVEPSVSGARLDVYVSSVTANMSRSLLKSCAKKILVNGADAKLSKKVNGGDKIRIEWQPIIPDSIEGEDIPLTVLFENEHVTVVNKAQGMVTHPACGNWSGTLVNALLFRTQNDECIGKRGAPFWESENESATAIGTATAPNRSATAAPQSCENASAEPQNRAVSATVADASEPRNRAATVAANKFVTAAAPLSEASDTPCAAFPFDACDLRPGIVHRLDKDTSGVLITAKDRETKQWLCTQFKERRVKKEYIAIVCGIPNKKSGSIKTGLIRDARNRKKFTWCDCDKGKFAHTLYRCIASYGPYSLMKIKLKTGRTHQIRVHMKYLGCPILGDPVYGKADPVFKSATLMLHSFSLTVRLAEGEKTMRFVASVPIRFKKVLRVLHDSYPKKSFDDE